MGPLASLRSLALAAALAWVAGTGCFVDEIDESMEQYPGGAAARAKETPKSPAPATRKDGTQPSGPSWW